MSFLDELVSDPSAAPPAAEPSFLDHLTSSTPAPASASSFLDQLVSSKPSPLPSQLGQIASEPPSAGAAGAMAPDHEFNPDMDGSAAALAAGVTGQMLPPGAGAGMVGAALPPPRPSEPGYVSPDFDIARQSGEEAYQQVTPAGMAGQDPAARQRLWIAQMQRQYPGMDLRFLVPGYGEETRQQGMLPPGAAGGLRDLQLAPDAGAYFRHLDQLHAPSTQFGQYRQLDQLKPAPDTSVLAPPDALGNAGARQEYAESIARHQKREQAAADWLEAHGGEIDALDQNAMLDHMAGRRPESIDPQLEADVREMAELRRLHERGLADRQSLGEEFANVASQGWAGFGRSVHGAMGLAGDVAQGLPGVPASAADALHQRAEEGRQYYRQIQEEHPIYGTFDRLVAGAPSTAFKMATFAANPAAGTTLFALDGYAQGHEAALDRQQADVDAGRLSPELAERRAELMGATHAAGAVVSTAFLGSNVLGTLGQQSLKALWQGSSQQAVEATIGQLADHYGFGDKIKPGDILETAAAGGGIALLLHGALFYRRDPLAYSTPRSPEDYAAMAAHAGLPESAAGTLRTLDLYAQAIDRETAALADAARARGDESVPAGQVNKLVAKSVVAARARLTAKDYGNIQLIGEAAAAGKFSWPDEASGGTSQIAAREAMPPSRQLAEQPPNPPAPFTRDISGEGMDLPPARPGERPPHATPAPQPPADLLGGAAEEHAATIPPQPPEQSGPLDVPATAGAAGGAAEAATAPSAPSVNELSGLEKSQAIVQKAIEQKDAATLKQWLHAGNRQLRQYFAQETGVKLPRTVQGTHDAIDQWAATPTAPPQQLPPSATDNTSSVTPPVQDDRQLERGRQLDRLLDQKIGQPEKQWGVVAPENSHGKWTLQQSMADSFGRGLNYEQWTQFNPSLVKGLNQTPGLGPQLWARARERQREKLAGTDSTSSAAPATPAQPLGLAGNQYTLPGAQDVVDLIQHNEAVAGHLQQAAPKMLPAHTYEIARAMQQAADASVKTLVRDYPDMTEAAVKDNASGEVVDAVDDRFSGDEVPQDAVDRVIERAWQNHGTPAAKRAIIQGHGGRPSQDVSGELGGTGQPPARPAGPRGDRAVEGRQPEDGPGPGQEQRPDAGGDAGPGEDQGPLPPPGGAGNPPRLSLGAGEGRAPVPPGQPQPHPTGPGEIAGELGGPGSDRRGGTNPQQEPPAAASPGPTPQAGESEPDSAAEPQAQAAGRPAKHAPTLAGDWTITDPDNTLVGGPKTKFRANVEAIKLVRLIEAEGRPATSAEQQAMAKWTGWGDKPGAFNGAAGWEREAAELKDLLSPEEYEAARRSTINAHYTSGKIVAAMWKGAAAMGFDGGRVLEPAVGSGVFFGLMPPDLRGISKLTGIDLDPLTARIARALYPSANIQIAPFQDVPIPNGFFDFSITNVPFSENGPFDKELNPRRQHSLHDWFFIRALAKTRPGGTVMGITSAFTMDKAGQASRAAMAAVADLVAAVRIPGGAFRKNAGTDVMTDLVILRKREPGQAASGPAWMNLAEVPDPLGGKPIPINEYFAAHPEQMMGVMDRSGEMYGPDQPNMQVPADFEDRFNRAMEALPGDGYHKAVQATVQRPSTPAAGKEKQGGLVVKEGKVYRRQGEELVEQHHGGKDPEKQRRLLEGQIPIRDSLQRLVDLQRKGDDPDATEAERKNLNALYDRFVQENGPLTRQQNARAFREDPDAPNLLALEKVDPDTKAVSKADIFSRNTAGKADRVGSVPDESAALGVTYNESGRIIPQRIAELLGMPETEAMARMVEKGLAYHNPAGGWEGPEQYLSGAVKKKLAEAKAAARADPAFKPNVAALEKVQPADIDYDQIDARLGAPWVPVSDVKQFAADLMGGDPSHFDIQYLPSNGAWLADYSAGGTRRHKGQPQDVELYGTGRAGFMDVLENALNGRAIRIRDNIGSSREPQWVDRPEETAAANGKIGEVQQRFADWLWDDDPRRQRLHRYYNDTFNDTVPPHYDGSHLTLPGSNPAVTLDAHQKNGVWRIVLDGTALLAHEVGTGKTYTMIAAGQEMKRMGLVKKPAHITTKDAFTGYVAQARHLYPHARILAVDKFDASNRARITSQIATGDYDMIIMTHDQLKLLPMSRETQLTYIREEAAELEEVLRQAEESTAGGGKAGNRLVKRLEKAKERLEERLKEAMAAARDDNVTFEQTGIDHLFVDEAHTYKSLAVYSTMDAKGVPSQKSDIALQMAVRARWLQQMNGGRGIVFATGTPVTNTLAEAFIMQKFLQGKALEDRGIGAFDAWARTFAAVNTKMEYKAAGVYQPVSRLNEFVNLAELGKLSHGVMDVVRAKNLAGFKRPQRKDYVHPVPMSADQAGYLESIKARAEALKNTRPEPGADNMLKISSDARAMSLDMRLVDPSANPQEAYKIAKVVENVLQIHRDNPGKTQMIFLDSGVHAKDGGYSAYDDIIARLVAGGIPRDQILNFSTLADAARRAAAEKLDKGQALVAIGGSKTLGTGVNAQKKLIALHHVDAPWLPAHLEQRDGRGWRQGNHNPVIHIHRYVTEGSFDTFMWQAVTNKQRFITAYMEADPTLRVAKEDDVEEMSPATVMAIASGNPLLMEKVQVDQDVADLRRASQRHQKDEVKLRDALAAQQRRIENNQADAAELQRQIEVAGGESPEFSMEMGGQTHSEREPAQAALAEAQKKVKRSGEWGYEEPIGRHRGLELHLRPGDLATGDRVRIGGGYSPRTAGPSIGSIEYNTRPAVLEAELRTLNAKTAALSNDVARAEKELGKPFAKAEQLNQSLARQKQLEDALVAQGKPPAPEEEEGGGPIQGMAASSPASAGGPVDDATFARQAMAAGMAIRKAGGPGLDNLKAKVALQPLWMKYQQLYGPIPLAEFKRRVVYNDHLIPVKEDLIPDDQRELLAQSEATVGQSAYHYLRLTDVAGNPVKLQGLEGPPRGMAASGGKPAKPRVYKQPVAPAPPANPPSPSAIKDALYGPGTFVGEDVLPKLADAAGAVAEGARTVRDLVAPQTAAGVAAKFAVSMRHMMSRVDMGNDRDVEAFKAASKLMDRLSQAEQIDFTDKSERGLPQADPALEPISRAIHAANDALLDEVRALGTGKLQDAIEHWLGRIWKDADKAKGFFAKLLGKKPLEGSKGFLKRRSYEWFTDGLTAGLEPVTYNPVDMALFKRVEMRKYVEAQKLFLEKKGQGHVKFVRVGGEPPENWQTVDDPLFKVHGPPTVKIKEGFDKGVRDGLLKLAADLGVSHQRRAAIGGGLWGSSAANKAEILTKFGGPDFVIAHELGHAIDDQYGIIDGLENDADPAKEAKLRQQLRDLADARFEHDDEASAQFKKYVRQREEKAAAVVQAYVAARGLFKQIAPDVLKKFEAFIDKHPALKPLRDIQPSMTLGTAEGEQAHGGLLLMGNYYVPAEAAQLFRNMLNPGLRQKSGLYRGWLGLGNLFNQMNLSFSAFHGVGSFINASVSDLALGLTQLSQGQFAAGAWHAVRGLLPGVSPLRGLIRGSKLLNEWYKPGSSRRQIADQLDAIVKGGGRARADRAFRSTAIQNMAKAWRETAKLSGIARINAIPRMLLRVPGVILQGVNYPILEYMVPRLKMAAAADLAARELARLGPGAKLDDVREAMRRAWDSIDNRFGQVVYDNLFWNRVVKDLAMGAVRSVGWNLGDLREFAGATVDAAKQAVRAGTGKRPIVTDRMAFSAALVAYVGMLGALLCYLMTGQKPEKLEDYYFPPTGGLDDNGHPIRLTLPTYMRDLVGIWRHPLKTMADKLHPQLSTVADLLMNKDYYGTRIANEDDPWMTRALARLKFFGKQTIPFSVQSFNKMGEQGESMGKRAASFAGFQETSPEFSLTPAERLAQELVRSHAPAGSRTQAQADKAAEQREMVRQMRRGTASPGQVLGPAIQQGQINREEAAKLAKKAVEPTLLHSFKQLEAREAMRVWAAASPQERELLAVQARQKVMRSKEMSPEEKRAAFEQINGSVSRQGADSLVVGGRSSGK